MEEREMWMPSSDEPHDGRLHTPHHQTRTQQAWQHSQPIVVMLILSVVTTVCLLGVIGAHKANSPQNNLLQASLPVHAGQGQAWKHAVAFFPLGVVGAPVAVVTVTTSVAEADDPAFWDATEASITLTARGVKDGKVKTYIATQATLLPPGGRVMNITFPFQFDITTIVLLEMTVDTQPCRPWLLDRVTTTLHSTKQNSTVQSFDSGYIGQWLCLAPTFKPIKLKHKSEVTQENIRIAYAIHAQHDTQFEQLFQHIYNARDLFCINIAPSVSSHIHDSIVQTVHTLAGHPLPSHVTITEMDTTPQSIALVDSLLLMMRILVDSATTATTATTTAKNDTRPWQFLFHIYDNYVPLKSRGEIADFLVAHPHRNFVGSHPALLSQALLAKRYLGGTGTHSVWPIDGLDFRAGTTYFLFSHGFVCDLIDHLGSALTGKVLESQFRTVDSPLRPYRLLKMLVTGTRFPIESFFLMSLLHGPYSETWVNQDVVFHANHNDAGQPCPTVPCTLTTALSRSISRAIREPSKLFAAPWDASISDSVGMVGKIRELTHVVGAESNLVGKNGSV